MSLLKKNSVLISGIVLAITSSLCCIIPALTIIGGIAGAASSLSWILPLRPYLIVATILAFGFAFYRAYKPNEKDACACATEKRTFFQSKAFLWVMTIISALLMSFPYYTSIFFASPARAGIPINRSTVATESFKVAGMTCQSCEAHVNKALLDQPGVFDAITRYEDGTTTVTFDRSKTSILSLMKRVSIKTGYKTSQ